MTATNTMTVLSTVTDIKVLDCLLALNLQVSIWSARKKLTPEDFSGVSALDLPPDDLASLGSKRVCDPDSLRIFSSSPCSATGWILCLQLLRTPECSHSSW